jgi:Asp-tRNA(Asn)/Glu-tRNA(Gln) amidotransferase A subunit family amidase
MTIDDPTQLGALEAARAIQAGDLTSVALVEALAARREDRDNAVGAWASDSDDQDIAHALDEAKARDAEDARGPLHGVPFGVKDIIDVAGLPSRLGSPIYADASPAIADAASVALARDAGMVPLGKTVTTEFALRTAGKTRNPLNAKYSPGGSSSGSAAAVADFQAPLAIGTQTGGSVIRPASYCGVVGYKPTFGRIPRAGVKSVSESLDTIGVFARNVADAAAFAAVLEGVDPVTLDDALDRPRFAFCRTPAWDKMSSDAHKAGRAAADKARAAGASVIDIDLPPAFKEALEAQSVVQSYEACRSLAFELRFRCDDVSRALKDYVAAGYETSRERYDWARNVQAVCRAAMWQVFSQIGAIITPAAPSVAPENPADTGSPICNQIWTMVGAPVVNTPGMTGAAAMPIGMQVIGPPGRAAETLGHAAWLHQALTKK